MTNRTRASRLVFFDRARDGPTRASREGGITRIASSDISMCSTCTKLSATETRESLNAWVDGQGETTEQSSLSGPAVRVSLSADGWDIVSTLAQRNVGAIYLKAAATPFEIKDSAGQTTGLVRETSLIFKENGDAGTIQQVDLVTGATQEPAGTA